MMSWLTARLCFGCSKLHESHITFQTCSRCKGAEYCSVDCQKKDFPSHKNRCKKLGTLLPKFQSSFLSDEQRDFVMKEKSGMDVWNRMAQEARGDNLVHLVRDIQSIVGVYIELALSKESKFPVEKALLWLNRSLKIVAYHTEYFPVELSDGQGDTDDSDEENWETCSNASSSSEESFKNIRNNNTISQEDKSIVRKNKMLRFGGDWDDGRRGKKVEHNNASCESTMKHLNDEKFNCAYYARRAALLENSPKGAADPFFCFGGRFNLPEVYVLMGKHQKAIDYINHWANTKLWSRPRAEGAIIEHFNDWRQGKHSSVNMYQYFEVVGSMIEGGDESRLMLRIYGVLMLVRLNAMKNLPHLKEKRRIEYQSFLLGTHNRLGENSAVSSLAGIAIPLMHIHEYVVNDPSESLLANEEYNDDAMNALITISANCMYYITGDERFISQMSMALPCAEAPNHEVNRLVWWLFQRLSDEEMAFLVQSYRRVVEEEETYNFR